MQVVILMISGMLSFYDTDDSISQLIDRIGDKSRAGSERLKDVEQLSNARGKLTDADLQRLYRIMEMDDNSYLQPSFTIALGKVGNKSSLEWLLENMNTIGSIHGKYHVSYVNAIVRLEKRLDVDVSARLSIPHRRLRDKIRSGIK